MRHANGLIVLTPPTVLPATVEELRANSRIDHSDFDSQLGQLIGAATQWIQEQTETSLITTAWRWTLDRFPRKQRWLTLPRWPVLEIDAIRYTAPDDSEGTIASDLIRLRRDATGRSGLALKDWAAWPSTRCTPDAIEIDFTAGFGEDATQVPEAWKQAILLLASHWFEHPEAVVTGTISTEVNLAVTSLLETLRDPDDDADGVC